MTEESRVRSMKIFLNVIGLLALLGGAAGFFLGSDAVSRILGGLALLVAVTALGFAKLIELVETHLERTSKQRLLERDWEKVREGQLTLISNVAREVREWMEKAAK